MHAPQRISELFFRQLQGLLTEKEHAELQDWISASPENQALANKLADPAWLQQQLQEYSNSREMIWKKLVEKAPELAGVEKRKKTLRWWQSAAAAAAVLFLVGAGIFFLLRREKPVNLPPAVVSQVTIPAGTNRASLRLSNGKILLLDSAASGKLATEQGISIDKSDSGLVSYSGIMQDSRPDLFNILTTPRGGQFALLLPDGTRVWLNAASSLKYPLSFSGPQRTVELQGEAYFEVTKGKPFTVHTLMQDVRVLGTHFNVHAYAEEEQSAITLLEGKVSVRHGAQDLLLLPGQQAWVSEKAIHRITGADTASVIAWKNGLTVFSGADLPSIMRMISRWYAIDIQLDPRVANRQFSGALSRHAPFEDVLKVLKLNQIPYTFSGQKLLIQP